MTARWTGTMKRDAETGEIRWTLRDEWHWEVSGTATRDADGGYVLDGTVQAPPACLRVPAIDGEDG